MFNLLVIQIIIIIIIKKNVHTKMFTFDGSADPSLTDSDCLFMLYDALQLDPLAIWVDPLKAI